MDFWEQYQANNPYPVSGIDSIGQYHNIQMGGYGQTGAYLADIYRQLGEQTRQALRMMQNRPMNQGIYLYGY